MGETDCDWVVTELSWTSSPTLDSTFAKLRKASLDFGSLRKLQGFGKDRDFGTMVPEVTTQLVLHTQIGSLGADCTLGTWLKIALLYWAIWH